MLYSYTNHYYQNDFLVTVSNIVFGIFYTSFFVLSLRFQHRQ
jgi:hypothetical protein